MKYPHFLILCLTITLVSCSEDYAPKRKGYNRIDLPKERQYISLADTMPYDFDYNKAAQILRDSSGIAERYWIEVFYPTYKAHIQFTYKAILRDTMRLNEYLGDAYKLSTKHEIKAEAMDFSTIITKSGKTVGMVSISGQVPSQLQFVVTDSIENFLRGALYYETATANDSLAPITEYIKEDIKHLLETLEWRQ